jgi:hypothetical protein
MEAMYNMRINYLAGEVIICVAQRVSFFGLSMALFTVLVLWNSFFLLNLVDQGPNSMRDKDPKFVILLEHPSRIRFPPNTRRSTARQLVHKKRESSLPGQDDGTRIESCTLGQE